MTGFQQNIEPALQDKSLRAAYEIRRADAATALQNIVTSDDVQIKSFCNSLNRTDDLKPAQAIVSHLTKDTSDVVVLGIGGSSLGAQAIAQIAFWGTPAYAPKAGLPRLHIIDNLDGDTFARFLDILDLKTTRFHVVSKSGRTVEPLLQMLAAMKAIEGAGGGKYLQFHFSGETEPGPNPLRALLEDIGAPMLEHDPNLGGRYTAFSTVGLVPAMLAGLDAVAFRKAGHAAFNAAIKNSQSVLDGAALSVAAKDVGLSQQIMWNYADRLERFAKWWRQLWAESLGKASCGTTPIDALGPVDQHSQLQLYLDGPPDKLFTLLHFPFVPSVKTGTIQADKHGLHIISGRDLNEVRVAQSRATAETLQASGRPVRTLTMTGNLNEERLAALMIHFILETLVAAKLWHVDPFGQPAVEAGKQLTRKFLEIKA